MLDCSNYVREALYSLLFGNITNGGDNVYVYKNMHFDTTPTKYIVIGNITETGATTNNNKFINEVEATIEIYVEQYRYQDLSVVDAISSTILSIIFPTPIHANIGDSTIAIYPIDRTSSQYTPLQDGDNFVSRKIMNIKFSINQI